MRMAFILAKLAVCLAAPALLSPLFGGDDGCLPQAPCYSAAGIVNSATGDTSRLAPFTYVTIYGINLSFETRNRSANDTLPGLAGVQVLIGDIISLVSYVSPTQINVLVPYSLKPNRDVPVVVDRLGTRGPRVTIHLREFAPAFFQYGPDTVVAQHDDWTVITADSPARPGGYAILYLTGLGPLAGPIDEYVPPGRAVQIQARSDLQLFLDGQPVDDSRIEYAGLVPTIPGLYQINLKLPDTAGANPEIQVAIRGDFSRPGLFLPLKGN
jgi:uncharacterized protein (TIGR03437 family)